MTDAPLTPQHDPQHGQVAVSHSAAPRPATLPLTSLVFAGGAAHRMGGEKCSLPFEGRGLLERVLDVAEEVADEVLLLSGDREICADVELQRVPDWKDVAGPLGALGAGLAVAGHEWSLALACDMPRLKVAVIDELRRRAADAPAHTLAVTIRTASGREPFCALYHRDLLPALRDHAARGGRSLQGWLSACAAAGRLLEVPLEALRAFDPELSFLQNINSPDDFGALCSEAGDLTTDPNTTLNNIQNNPERRTR